MQEHSHAVAAIQRKIPLNGLYIHIMFWLFGPGINIVKKEQNSDTICYHPDEDGVLTESGSS